MYLNATISSKPKAKIYKAIDVSCGKTIGHVEFSKIDWNKKTATLARVLIAPEYRCKKLGNEIVEKALMMAFDVLNFEMLNLCVYSFNTSAIRCYEKTGFKTKEIIKNCSQYDSESWDGIIMTISMDDFNNRKLIHN